MGDQAREADYYLPNTMGCNMVREFPDIEMEDFQMEDLSMVGNLEKLYQQTYNIE